MADFSKDKIKDYKYWEIYVGENQGYLGRCVVWCKREDALDLTDATKEELDELITVIRDLKKAVERAFDADWFNYSFLGNGVRHLHAHFIPRYSSPREFVGTKFEDKRWGNNFRTDKDFVTSDELKEKVKQEIQKELGK